MATRSTATLAGVNQDVGAPPAGQRQAAGGDVTRADVKRALAGASGDPFADGRRGIASQNQRRDQRRRDRRAVGESDDGRVGQTLRVNGDAWRQMQRLVGRTGVPKTHLYVEAMNLLFQKYGVAQCARVEPRESERLRPAADPPRRSGGHRHHA